MRTAIDVAREYLRLWNAEDEADRLRFLEGWTDQARYRDPLMQAEGRAAIAAMISGAKAQFPGHAFALQGTPDGHGPYVRFSWTLAPDGGMPLASGTDVVRLEADDRIAEVVGFLDERTA